MASTSSTSLMVSPRCTDCSPDLPAAFLSFTSRQKTYLAFHLSLTHDDALANGAFAHLECSTMSLRTLLDGLIASSLIPEPDKTKTFRPWRSLLIDLTDADLRHMNPEAYYRMQAQMDLLCYSSVQPRNDNGSHESDLTTARNSVAELETQMQMPMQESFALEDMAGAGCVVDTARSSTTRTDEASAYATDGAAEVSEDGELLADIERLAGTPERAMKEAGVGYQVRCLGLSEQSKIVFGGTMSATVLFMSIVWVIVLAAVGCTLSEASSGFHE